MQQCEGVRECASPVPTNLQFAFCTFQSAILVPTHTPTHRLPALDALRAGAVLLGIALHAAVPYMALPVPRLLWSVREPASPLFGHLFWAIHGGYLPAFFLLAGFCAARSVAARGPAAFLRQRGRRLLVPLFGGGAVLLPLTYYAWAWGWQRAGLCTAAEVRRVRFADPFLQDNFLGPAHLWFLEYLFLLCLAFSAWYLAALLARKWGNEETRKYPVRTHFPISSFPHFLRHGISPFPHLPAAAALVACSGLLLAAAPGAGGVFRNSFVPSLPLLAYYGTFFFAGAWLHDRPGLMQGLPRRGPGLAVAALACFVLEAWVRARYPDGPATVAGRLALGGTTALYAWVAVAAGVAVCLRAFPRPDPALRALADASFWFYLAHVPVVGFIHALLHGTPVPVALKFTLAAAAGLGVGVLSYQKRGLELPANPPLVEAAPSRP